MRYNHTTITITLIAFLQITTIATGNEIVGDIPTTPTNSYDENGISEFQMHLTSRLLENDETCSRACDESVMSSFVSSTDVAVEVTVETDDVGFLGRITGFFNGSMFERLMNGLFNFFVRRRNEGEEENPKYMIPTDTILPLLSNYTVKFKALAKMIRQQSENYAALSATPDAIQMMYNISAENMESVASVLDPILEDMRQHETMDFRTIACGMMQLLTGLRDFTIPNIETIAKVIYTKSNNTAMMDRFNQYNTSTDSVKSSSTAFATTTSKIDEDNTCLETSRTTTPARFFIGDYLFGILFDSSVDVGPIGHIVSIIKLIIIFPLSIVVSIIGIIALIFFLIFQLLRTDLFDTSDDGYLGLILSVLFIFSVGAPIYVIAAILQSIRSFFEDILDPFLPDRPTPAPAVYTFYPTWSPSNDPTTTMEPSSAPIIAHTVSTPTIAPIVGLSSIPGLSSEEAKHTADVMYRLSVVLESPIDTFVSLLQDADSLSNMNQDEEEEMDCEVAALNCKNDALIDVFPF